MESIENNEVTDNILEKYTEEEFKEVIAFLSHQQLIDPMKRLPKTFSKEIKGFRADKLPLEKINEIYINRIFKKKDKMLSQHFNKIEKNFIQDINEKITNKEHIRVEEIDELSFECLVENLLDTKLKNNIELYFKMINCKLKRKESTFLKYCLEYLIQNKEKEKQLKDRFKIQNENNVKEVDEKYKKLLNNKENVLNNKIEELNCEKQQVITSYEELYNENIRYENEIIELKDLCQKEYTKQSEIYEERWIHENYDLEEIKKKIKTDIEHLENKLKNKKEEIELLDIEKNEIEESINIVKNKAGDVIENIEIIIQKLKKEDNIDETTIYKIESKMNEISSDRIISTTDDFIDDLADNLLICGVLQEYAIDLAQYIYSILASEMNLLLIGYNSRKIANAISYLISDSTPEIINISLGYSNYNQLSNLVNTSNAKVILIENSIDVISENIYLPLIKEKKDKHIIFSMESTENINILPNCILNYMGIVDLDSVLSFESSEELIGGISDENIFTVRVEESIRKKCVKDLNKISTAIRLNNSIKIKVSEIMGIVEGLNPNKAMYDTLIFSILILCKEKGDLEELEECVSNLKLGNNTCSLLQKLIIEELKNNE